MRIRSAKGSCGRGPRRSLFVGLPIAQSSRRLGGVALHVISLSLLLVFQTGFGIAAQASSRKAPVRPAASPAKPAEPAATPHPLPAIPIPVEHVQNAGIGQCKDIVGQMSREVLTSQYDAQSGWNLKDPPNHVFQSVAGVVYPRNTPPNALAALIAAPMGPEHCDGVAVQVYPLAQPCDKVQNFLSADTKPLATLMNIRVVLDAHKKRLFLLPGLGKSCIAISVVSYFEPR
jgi:hypothetical protein